jgi:hypothetical protein
MKTSKNRTVLVFATAIVVAGAGMFGWVNHAGAGNEAGRAESGKVLRTIPAKPLPGFVNTIHPILSPGQKPAPGFVNTIHPIIVGRNGDHDRRHPDRDRDRRVAR